MDANGEVLLEEELLSLTEDEIRAGFAEVLRVMKTRSIGQEELIRGLLLAVLSREHMLLVGPWGCNKTAAINLLTRLLGVDDRTFHCTLDKTSPPQDLLGMYSPRALQVDDKWVRNMTGKLPEAVYAFVGEVFRGNGATRTALHTVINERYVENDGKQVPVPLLSMFCDSNTFPYREEDMPFYDRLLLRQQVSYLSGQGQGQFSDMLRSPEVSGNGSVKAVLSLETVRQAIGWTAVVAVSDAAVETLFQVRAALLGKEIVLSDRRWKRSLNVLRASAWLRGVNIVDSVDFTALRYVLWHLPEQYPVMLDVLESFCAVSPETQEAEKIAEATRVFDDALLRVSNVDVLAEALLTLGQLSESLTDAANQEALQEMLTKLDKLFMGANPAGDAGRDQQDG